MFPYLTDLVNYFSGTSFHLPFYTYGFILVVATFFVFIAVYAELKRRGTIVRFHRILKNPF
jgi:Na+/H+ antiporter NhaD/arsenite permease-like protein